nr:Tetratricopeptide-like helical domain containing protein [Ipomoea batatas]
MESMDCLVIGFFCHLKSCDDGGEWDSGFLRSSRKERKDLWGAEQRYQDAVLLLAEQLRSMQRAMPHFLWSTGGETTCASLWTPSDE